MSYRERKHRIMNLLRQQGSVRVAELAPLLDVSDETVRKDLDALSDEGLLRRTHGGAIPLLDVQSLTPHLERENANAELKQAIAQAALQHIQPHDTIALDGSTTVSFLTKLIPDMPLTVVTNSMHVAFELSSRDHINVISVGGMLLRQSHSFHGSMTERILREYHVGKAFLSCTGLHPDRGFSDSNEAHASVKKQMIGIADDVFFLIDSSKMGIRDLVRIAPSDSPATVITDSGTRPEWVELFDETPIEFMRAEPQ
ncbi:DeoR/GlpR family DNA-binding transcription regulator [Paenibacillus sp. NPDC058071]|uniref:DeoR/GlpR family DNA-binding transcription regulator n=1 Tax=Paenibacillus sp. NPDC058071 TaxID=3346326 RepID=UPI0036DC3DE3